MHSMQAGYLEKAQKYTDKALMQLEKLKSRFVETQWILTPVMLNQLWCFCSKCWTAIPSCPRSKSSCWSISSCAALSPDTRPQLCRRSDQQDICSNTNTLKRSALINTVVVVAFIKISQVCQLCQQSPRLFNNHAAQLHTLLVSLQSEETKGITGMIKMRRDVKYIT